MLLALRGAGVNETSDKEKVWLEERSAKGAEIGIASSCFKLFMLPRDVVPYKIRVHISIVISVLLWAYVTVVH